MSQDLIFGTHQDSKIEQSGAIINGFVECFLGHVCPTSETARKHKDVSLLGITARYPYQWRIQDFPGGATIIWYKFYRKLRENEKHWTERGRVVCAPPPIRHCTLRLPVYEHAPLS